MTIYWQFRFRVVWNVLRYGVNIVCVCGTMAANDVIVRQCHVRMSLALMVA